MKTTVMLNNRVSWQLQRMPDPDPTMPATRWLILGPLQACWYCK